MNFFIRNNIPCIEMCFFWHWYGWPLQLFFLVSVSMVSHSILLLLNYLSLCLKCDSVEGGHWEDVTVMDPPASVPWEYQAPPHALVFGMSVQPTVPTLAAVFKDTTLREQWVCETIWTEEVTAHSSSLSKTFKILAGRHGDVLILQHPGQASYVSSLAC